MCFESAVICLQILGECVFFFGMNLCIHQKSYKARLISGKFSISSHGARLGAVQLVLNGNDSLTQVSLSVLIVMHILSCDCR
jgi:hypothetical protein